MRRIALVGAWVTHTPVAWWMALAMAGAVGIVAGSPTLHYRYQGGAFTAQAMTPGANSGAATTSA